MSALPAVDVPTLHEPPPNGRLDRGADPVVSVRGLTKSYHGVPILHGIDLEVFPGEVLAVLGPNGAGKTTTVEILEGLRRRDDGSVMVAGCDPSRPNRRWRNRVGIVFQGTGALGELTVREAVRHFARYYARPMEPDEVIALVGLEDCVRRRCRKLSGGQQRRLDLALGIIGNPELLFLDEPTTGLDPVGRRTIWQLIERLRLLGTSTILTTHYLDEAETLADRVVCLVEGRVVAEGPPRTFAGRDSTSVSITFDATGTLHDRPIPDLGDALVERTEDSTMVEVTTDEPTRAIATLTGWAADAGIAELPSLAVRRATLEDTYLRLIRSADTP